MKIMGVLNITPDSFSDGGLHFSHQKAVEQALKMVEEGADIIDIGGESTKPFAEPVSFNEELRRVMPVIQTLREESSIPISIDTTKAEVARKAIEAGATIINDVSAMRQDPAMIDLVTSCSLPIIIMHMKGTPRTMQIQPEYDDVVAEVISFFKERLAWLEGCGVERSRVTIDPGIGFGKKLEHNLSLLKHLGKLKELKQPLLLGHSRKRFIGDLTGLDVEERDLPTAAISALSVVHGVDMVRVHNVAATKAALAVSEAIHQAV